MILYAVCQLPARVAFSVPHDMFKYSMCLYSSVYTPSRILWSSSMFEMKFVPAPSETTRERAPSQPLSDPVPERSAEREGRGRGRDRYILSGSAVAGAAPCDVGTQKHGRGIAYRIAIARKAMIPYIEPIFGVLCCCLLGMFCNPTNRRGPSARLCIGYLHGARDRQPALRRRECAGILSLGRYPTDERRWQDSTES